MLDELDAKEIATLTQSDVLEFFLEYVSPSSLSRAKLSVHLLAALTEGIDECNDQECTTDGHLYSLSKDGTACCVQRSEWKESQNRISVAPRRGFARWQMPTCLYHEEGDMSNCVGAPAGLDSHGVDISTSIE